MTEAKPPQSPRPPHVLTDAELFGIANVLEQIDVGLVGSRLNVFSELAARLSALTVFHAHRCGVDTETAAADMNARAIAYLATLEQTGTPTGRCYGQPPWLARARQSRPKSDYTTGSATGDTPS
jgi:hypothetical protein